MHRTSTPNLINKSPIFTALHVLRPLRLWKFAARHSNSVREAVLGTQASESGAITNGCLTDFNSTLNFCIFINLYDFMYLVKRKNAFTGRFLICGLWNAVIFPIKLLVFSSSVCFSSKITNWVSGICWAIRCFCLRWSRPVVSRSTLWRRGNSTFPCLWPRLPKPQLDWLVDLAFITWRSLALLLNFFISGWCGAIPSFEMHLQVLKLPLFPQTMS